jgi:hypothetical protein
LPPDRSTHLSGGAAIIVHNGIDYFAVPLLGLQDLEANFIHLMLATRPVNFVSAYVLPIRPLIESDMTLCLSGGIPVQ